MSERAILIPGYGDTLGQSAYRPLCSLVETQYPFVHKLHIPWERGTYTDWFSAAREQVCYEDADIFAFSCGALIALQMASKDQVPNLRVDSLLLLSTSSWGGGKGSMESSSKNSGQIFSGERFEVLEGLPVEEFALNCSAKSIRLFYGERELPEMKARSRSLATLLGERATLLAVPDAEHYDVLGKVGTFLGE